MTSSVSTESRESRSCREGQRGGRSQNEFLVVKPGDAGRDVQTSVVLNNILEVAAAGTDLKHRLLLQAVALDKPTHLLVDVSRFSSRRGQLDVSGLVLRGGLFLGGGRFEVGSQ